MDREKAKKLLEIYGHPAFKAKGSNTVLVFARQSMKDVEEIESWDDSTLIQRWKNRIWLNCIYGQVSLNEMQRIQLIELEMGGRKIDFEKLEAWFAKAKEEFDEKDFR